MMVQGWYIVFHQFTFSTFPSQTACTLTLLLSVRSCILLLVWPFWQNNQRYLHHCLTDHD